MTPTEQIVREQELAKEVTAITVLPFAAIETPETYTQGIDVARIIKGKMGEVDMAYDDLIAEANKHHKNLIATKNKYWQPLKNAFDAIERMLSAYREKKECERKAEELRLQEIARQEQESRLLAEAAALENSGNHSEAAQVLEEAITAPAPVVIKQSEVPVIQGAYSRQLPWEFEIIKPDLVRDEFWCPDVEAIKAVVKAKGNLAEFLIGKGSVRIWRGTKIIIKK